MELRAVALRLLGVVLFCSWRYVGQHRFCVLHGNSDASKLERPAHSDTRTRAQTNQERMVNFPTFSIAT